MSNRSNERQPGRLPGSGVSRSMQDTWGSIAGKLQTTTERNNPAARLVAINRISPNPNQPRQQRDPERDAELAADIAVRGILEPIIVRPQSEDESGPLYEIVAGERRFRAAQAAELTDVPVIVKDYNDQQARLAALVENVQRADLDPRDEARFLQYLSNEYNFSQRQLADLLHKSQPYVSLRLKLLVQDVDSDSEENHKLLKNSSLSKKSQSTQAIESFQDATNDSEENHKLLKNSSLSKKSQSTPALRTFNRFRTFLTQTQEHVAELPAHDRQTMTAQIQEMHEQLTALEQALTKEPE